MKIAVISPTVPSNVRNIINVEEYLIYACDGAVSKLKKQNINIDLAIGDFDSLEDLTLLNELKTIKLNKEKDFSDTSYAIKHAYNHSDKVILVGGIKGNRIDHFLANLFLLETYNNLVILDDTNKIFLLNKGSHNINKNDYKYLSLFPMMDSIISINGTKYVLNKEKLLQKDQLGLSNEILDLSANLNILEGKILVIQSK